MDTKTTDFFSENKTIIIIGVVIFLMYLFQVKKLQERFDEYSDGKYVVSDYVVYTDENTDLDGQPMQGTIQKCEEECNKDMKCQGFSRDKNAKDDDVNANCWLKKNLFWDKRVINDPTYQTHEWIWN